jgi:hypothetical protein
MGRDDSGGSLVRFAAFVFEGRWLRMGLVFNCSEFVPRSLSRKTAPSARERASAGRRPVDRGGDRYPNVWIVFRTFQ